MALENIEIIGNLDVDKNLILETPDLLKLLEIMDAKFLSNASNENSATRVYVSKVQFYDVIGLFPEQRIQSIHYGPRIIEAIKRDLLFPSGYTNFKGGSLPFRISSDRKIRKIFKVLNFDPIKRLHLMFNPYDPEIH